MSIGNDAALKALAEATAATVQATVQQWWLDPAHPRLLHIAAERTFVGAKPIAVHFTVRLQPGQTVAAAGPARMRVGVSVVPPPVAAQKASSKPVTRSPAQKAKRQIRTKVASSSTKSRKPRARSNSPTRTTRPKKRIQQSRQRMKRQAPSRTSGRKARGSS